MVQNQFMQNLRLSILPILGLAIAYALAGRFSLWLAIPPGYSMAVYPPAGIALGMIVTGGYRLLPGVALGSFFVNIFVSFENTGNADSTSITIAALIAFGATLQAGISTYFIRQEFANNLSLNSHAAIFRFFLIGGALGCLISASVGVSSLYFLGILPITAMAGNWLTWWIGDTFGVLTITPIILILFAQPRQIWISRRLSVMLPLVICLILVIIAFTFIRDRELQRQRLEFRLEAERITQQLQIKLNNHSEAVKNIERFFASSDNVDRTDFDNFVSNTLQNHKEITGLRWAPKILSKDRTAFEKSIQNEGFPHFHITEQGSESNLVDATSREDYFPITYLSPFKSDNPVFGYDFGSTAIRRSAIEDASETGLVTATDPIRLVIGKRSQFSILLFAPIYAHRKPIDNISQRKDAFIGVAASLLIMSDLIENLQSKEQHAEVLLKFYDLSYPSGNGIFFNNIEATDKDHAVQTTLDFGGRQYALQTQPSAQYWKTHSTWITWITMTGGLLFTGLLGVYLLMSTGHTFTTEALVAQRTAELHDREERLDAILSNAAEGIITTNDLGEIESANQSAYSLLGHENNNLLGKNIFDLFPDPESRNFLLQHLIKNTTENSQKNITDTKTRHQLVGKRKDNTEIPLELAITRVELGAQTIFVTMLHDLTEEKRAEKLKSEFVSAVSHELRTPLTSIRGALGLLVGGIGGVLPEKSIVMLKMANDNAIRLTTLINDLLDFEKLEYGGMQFTLAKTSLRELLEKSIQANQGYAQNYRIAVRLDQAINDDVLVLVDSQRFIQVLSNLLSNAIKFSRDNGRVDIRTISANNWVRIEVQDYGIGISKEFKNSIFQKFSQEDAKAARKYAGTGLGLSLAKNMIEKMHGRIGFTSIEGEGSIFFIELPVQPSH